MKIKQKIIAIIIFSIIIYGVFGIISYFNLNQLVIFSEETYQSIENIKKSSDLDSLAQFIRYYDEVLTQAARNYAFTGDAIWKNRYNDFVPELDNKIKQAISKGSEEDKSIFLKIDQANIALVEMEVDSMDKTDKGNREEAVKILQSKNYWDQKNIYQSGLEQYAKNKGKDYEEILSASTNILENNTKEIKNILIFNRNLFLLMFFACIALLFFVYLSIKRLIFAPLNEFKKNIEEISKGNLSIKIKIKRKDEIGILAESFNYMTEELKKSKENIEEKIEKRTEELEKLNSLMVGRELKMLELKKKIIELENKNN